MLAQLAVPKREPVNEVAWTLPFTWRVASVGVVVPIPTLPLRAWIIILVVIILFIFCLKYISPYT